MAKILLVDDDKEVLQINKKFLIGEGYSVRTISDPLSVIADIKGVCPDLIVMDIMMPGMTGYELCSKIREFSPVPIIFLTGKSSEDDKIEGLVTGADDYIVKPYSLRELKARIDVVLRRSAKRAPEANSNVLTFGDLSIDKLAHTVTFRGEDLGLANREYEVLLYMASRPNTEVTFEELGTALFGSYEELDRRSVMVNVSRLRKKMAGYPELENMLETVWSKGYRFVAGTRHK